ncbi:hypothetical protein ACERZ8_10730 [Tateyamaria armeniaca]|uniref:Uncharacterized protein n=1 Tax=Tateyamaria armeniaca TaxID=2518930 RepID=A0ABW8UU93_9RHOB
MPRKSKPAAKRGTHRPATKVPKAARPPAPAARPAHLRTQVRGGRPPRFPGRTGGR